jgi:dTDP-4-dehydrorhamnose reductase/UDP-glucose 4-epimerase
MTRIILLGGGSFIARAVSKAASARGVVHVALSHDEPLNALETSDCVFNFALSPAYSCEAYSEAEDCDLKAARAAAAAGAWFGMLSTRRVYSALERWNAREDMPVAGDETVYGRNKATTEKAILEIPSGMVAIFRLSNVFGYEYDQDARRRTFLGRLLTSLKQNNKIYFDMSPATRRDFLPVESCAGLLLDRALARTTGTYNLGSGLPLACGAVADWVRQGYGGGELVCEPDSVRDEFYLNMDKWRAEFPLPVTQESLRDYCVGLGRRLMCEKS